MAEVGQGMATVNDKPETLKCIHLDTKSSHAMESSEIMENSSEKATADAQRVEQAAQCIRSLRSSHNDATVAGALAVEGC